MMRVLGDPRWQRWLPLIVLPPILLLDGVLANEKDVTALSVVLTYLAVLPLALRTRLGFFTMAPLLVGGVILLLGNYDPAMTVVALPAWGLFDMAQTYGRRQSLIAAVALAPCVFICVLPFADDGSELVSVFLRNFALCELALAAGYLLWHKREELEREVAAHAADSERRLGDERLRIAREVHDVVAHAMVAINVQAGVAAHLLDHDTEQAREALLQIKRTSGEALTDLRATLGVLRDPEQVAPGGLDDLDAVAGQLRAAGVDVTVDVATVGGVPTPVQSASYRIVQEALTNALRHANARAVSVVVRTDAEALTIAVADDGTGRQDASGAGGAGGAGTSGTAGAGAGVRGMRERAEALGGRLTAGPRAEGGWRVEATLPVARP